MKKVSIALIICVLLALLAFSAFAAGGSSMARASSISFGQTYSDSITETQREDYYKATLSQSGRITIDITSYMRYYCIVLYNDAGEELWYTHNNEWVSTTGKRSDTYKLDLEAGTYYLKFNGYRAGTYDASTGNYTFKVAFAASGANIAEPNNNIAESKAIAFGTQYKGCIAINDREDYYEIALNSSGRIAIDITSYMRYYCIVLYNDAGEELWYTHNNEWISTTGRRSDSYKLDLEAGTYFLKFNGYRAGTYDASTGNYTFKVTFSASGANIDEPNNSIVESKTIGFGKQYKGSIAINDREDYYEVSLNKSGRLTIDITSFMHYYCIVLYNDAGEELWYTDNNEWVSTTGKRSDLYKLDLEAGTYYLKFNGYRYSTYDASTGNYSFKLSFAASNANVAEPNNSIADAKNIKPDTKYNGQIAINDREDYYQFKLSGSQKVKLNLTSYMRYYCVTLYNNDGKELWYTNNNEWNSTTGKRTDTHELDLSSGEYYMKINGYRYSTYDASTGNYSFSISTKVTVAAPKSVKASANKTTSVKLTCSPVSGVTGYFFYRYDTATKKYIYLGASSTTSFTVKKLKAGTKYQFAAKAYKMVNGTKYQSALSSPVKTATRPATPTVSVTPGKKQAVVKWKAVSGAAGYLVYRSASANGSFSKIGTTTGTSFKATKLSTNKTYYFKVVAYTKVGSATIRSAASKAVGAKIR